jgi:hypothetical protein
MKTRSFLLASCALLLLFFSGPLSAEERVPRDEVVKAMRKAATFFRSKVAVQGGYVWHVSENLAHRWGEGSAGPQQIWVQPPGTPAVGMALLAAHAATGESLYLDAAREAAEALAAGQLESGGWSHSIDFDSAGKNAGRYRSGKGRAKGRNVSTLDDNTTQSALRFLMHADRALQFKHTAIHAAVEFGRAALLRAQFPHGGFPQGWDGPVADLKPQRAQFPDYEWRTEHRSKDYWFLPTLNDGLCTDIILTLQDGAEIYKDEGCRRALTKLGDFLIMAQLPEPQPGWAQQYTPDMRPAWARKFEPPAVSGRESEDAVEALMAIHRFTGDAKYLTPIQPALAWLGRSMLPNGQIARFYELRSNKPLYMTKDYTLTYDDSDVPSHYGWKANSNLAKLEAAFAAAQSGTPLKGERPSGGDKVRTILKALDSEGRWLSQKQLKGLPEGQRVLVSDVFVRNLETLSRYAAATR